MRAPKEDTSESETTRSSSRLLGPRKRVDVLRLPQHQESQAGHFQAAHTPPTRTACSLSQHAQHDTKNCSDERLREAQHGLTNIAVNCRG